MTTKLSDLKQQCIIFRILRIDWVISLFFSHGLTYAAAVSRKVQEDLSLMSGASPGMALVARMAGPLFSTWISILGFFT